MEYLFGSRASVLLIVMMAMTGCASAPQDAPAGDGRDSPVPLTPGDTFRESGQASYYSDALHGRSTASGEPYDKSKLTAAHKSLPFGTRVRVTNSDNGQSVTVRINDCGPFVAGRIIDLSRAAAERIGLITAGIAAVEIQAVR